MDAVLSPEQTKVTVQLDWQPSGILETAGAAIGIDDHQVTRDLGRFKQLLESRDSETGAWRGTYRARADRLRQHGQSRAVVGVYDWVRARIAADCGASVTASWSTRTPGSVAKTVRPAAASRWGRSERLARMSNAPRWTVITWMSSS